MFKEISHTFFDPDFYTSIKDKTFGHTIKTYAKFCLIVSFIVAIIFIIFALPILNKGSKWFINEIENRYPTDLVVTIKDGEVSTNGTEPLFLPINESGEVIKFNGKTIKNIVAIDTVSKDSLELFEQYQAFVYISKSNVYTMDDSSVEVMKITPYKETIVINKELVDSFIIGAEKVLKIVFAVLPLIVFIITLFINFVLTLFMLLFYAFVIWLIMVIKKIPSSYSLAYKTGIYLMIPVMIVHLIIFFVFPPLFLNFLVSVLLIIIFGFLNIQSDVDEVVVEAK